MIPPSVTLYTDFNCPFCYVMAAAIKRISMEMSVSVEWKGYPLHPEIPDSGMDLTQMMDASELKGMLSHLNRLGEPLNIAFSDLTVMNPSAPALEAACFARDHGMFGAFYMAVFRAAFTDLQNISDIKVLKRIAALCGLDADAMAAAVQQGVYAGEIRQNRLDARENDILMLPTVLCQDASLVGAKSLSETRIFFEKLVGKIINNA